MVTLAPVVSRMIAAAGYDPQRGILYVLYNSGRAYEYYGVSQEEYDALLKAESIGRYMHHHILPDHRYSRFKGWH